MAKIYWKVSSTTLYLRNNSATGYSAWTESENAYPAWATDTNRNKIVTINIQNSITPTYFYRWFYNFVKLQTITNWNNLKLTNITDMSNTFEGCAVFNQEIAIPSSVINMSCCFKGCTKFNQAIEIPDSITDMSSCFEGCTSFDQEVTIPNSVINMSSCFKNCTSFLRPITIPNSVTDMTHCFYGCRFLKFVAALNNPTNTEDIFYGTTFNIKMTVISDSLNSDEYNTWNSIVQEYNNVSFTSDLTTTYFSFTIGDYNYTNLDSWGEPSSYIRIHVKNTQQTIYEPITVPYINNVLYNLSMYRCFEGCTSFDQEVTIPDGVIDMSYCFAHCESFDQPIEIPNSVTNMTYCFYYCESFDQSIEIPDSVTNMSYCFYNCFSFNQSIEIPNSVTNMAYCFHQCTPFNQLIIIPNSVTDMSYCFFNCFSFNQPIEIPDSVTNMAYCFFGCKSFNQPITIPNSVTNMLHCFYNCASLNNIITINNLILLTETNYYSKCFYNTTQKIILCCDYRTDSTMKNTLNAIAATANNNNVQVGELSITVTANRDNINTTNANVQVTITRFRGNNEVINAIDIYKDDSSIPEIVTWSPSDMRMDTAVKTFTTTISNVNEAKTVQLKVIARDDFSDSAPQYATVATNFYTMDVLAGGKEISFGMKAVQDDLYESIQDETVPTFETNKFYERVVNSETGYNSYILLETEPDDWGTNWNDYYVLVHEDGLFKCAMDAQFNNSIIFKNPTEVFITQEYTRNYSLTSGADLDWTENNIEKPGYYPIGVVGFRTGRTVLHVTQCRIYNIALGSCTFRLYAQNESSSTQTGTAYAYILWVKAI